MEPKLRSLLKDKGKKDARRNWWNIGIEVVVGRTCSEVGRNVGANKIITWRQQEQVDASEDSRFSGRGI